ncbi:UNVERIFIED_CONTAM: hypothetical protein FKN15_020723 [Acipenser sinensis]
MGSGGRSTHKSFVPQTGGSINLHERRCTVLVVISNVTALMHFPAMSGAFMDSPYNGNTSLQTSTSNLHANTRPQEPEEESKFSSEAIWLWIAIIATIGNVVVVAVCLDYKPPFKPPEPLTFCTEYSQFGCCDSEQEQLIMRRYYRVMDFFDYSGYVACGKYIQSILCQECCPYAAHLYDAEDANTPMRELPGLCGGYCTDFWHRCRSTLSLLTEDDETIEIEGDRDKFCAFLELKDPEYCYPNVLTNAELNADLGAVRTDPEGCLQLCLQEVANLLRNPVAMVHANDGTHRFFIAEQLGYVWAYLPNGSRIDKPFLNLTKAVLTSPWAGDERGFLCVAFHPRFKSTGKAYVYYSVSVKREERIRISEFALSVNDMNALDPASERILLEVVEPASNHNGGQLLFGYDGYLYIFVGDGGKAGDPFGEFGNAQNNNRADCSHSITDDILPIFAYPHKLGKSVTGGYVYRGCEMPNLNGLYIFGDFMSGRLMSLKEDPATGEWHYKEICMGKGQTCNFPKTIITYYKYIISFAEDEAASQSHLSATNKEAREPYQLTTRPPPKRHQTTSRYHSLVETECPTTPRPGFRKVTAMPPPRTQKLNVTSVPKTSDKRVKGHAEELGGSNGQTHVNKKGRGAVQTKVRQRKMKNGAVRLASDGEKLPDRGRVEIHVKGEWGTVCDDLFDSKAGAVVCRQLGYPFVLQVARRAEMGEGSNLNILLDDVKCEGTEKTLLECKRAKIREHNCSHKEDVGVVCGYDEFEE